MASTSRKPLLRPLMRMKRRIYVVCFALAVIASTYLATPFYWVSEAIYWEAVFQSRSEQYAIRWVIANRKDSDRPEWSKSFRGVILDGAARGNNREFTYRHKQKRWWIPEGAPILPLAHAWRNGQIGTWMVIQADTFIFLTGYYLNWSNDPTRGAVFYKVDGHPNTWFEKMIKAGRLCEGRKVDAHVFYKLCLPADLKGSRAAVLRAYHYAVRGGEYFVRSGDDFYLKWWVRWWWLDELRPSTNLRLSQVSYPFLLPEVYEYVTRLAEQYKERCNEVLTVTSALRPVDEQPSNASRNSVHPTGMALDLSITDNRCTEWLEEVLILGEQRGYLDATRESFPPHFHVVVFPKEYREWLKGK